MTQNFFKGLIRCILNIYLKIWESNKVWNPLFSSHWIYIIIKKNCNTNWRSSWVFWSIEPIPKMCWSRDRIMSEDIIRVRNPERGRDWVNIEKRGRFFRQNSQIVLDYIILFDTILEEKCQSLNQRSEVFSILTRVGYLWGNFIPRKNPKFGACWVF